MNDFHASLSVGVGREDVGDATGHGDTCPATGDTQRGAEKHAEQTGHGTVVCMAGVPFDRGAA